jgi:hypothetical protein
MPSANSSTAYRHGYDKTTKILSALIDAVAPLYPVINAYLDETGDAEHAVPYGDLAQAAIEAQLELDRRIKGQT